MWFDASDANVINLTGALVNSVDNKADNGTTFWNGTGTQRPSLVQIGGADAVFFNGAVTQHVLSMGDTASIQNNWATGGYTAILARFNSEVLTFPRISQKGGTQDFQYSNPGVSGVETPLSMNMPFSTTNGRWQANTASEQLPIDQEVLVEIEYDSSSAANDPVFRFNGVEVTVTETVTPVGTKTSDAGQAFLLGNSGGVNKGGDFYLREMIVARAIPSSQELSRLYSYLEAKWPVTLP